MNVPRPARFEEETRELPEPPKSSLDARLNYIVDSSKASFDQDKAFLAGLVAGVPTAWRWKRGSGLQD
jgi:hypothetical protein